MARDIYKKTLNIEFEQDWSVVQALRQATDKKLTNIIQVTRIFPGKADSAILLGFQCIINPQNLIKIVGAIFEKMKIKIFLSELPLILRVDRKRKNKLDIFAMGPQISNMNEIGQLVQALRQATHGEKIKNYFSSFRDVFFLEKPIVSYCWFSNVL